jgi:ABC-type glutathione transport system ATPase component
MRKTGASSLLHRVSTIPPDRRDVLTAVLDPYVSALQARLDRLKSIHDSTALFIRELNEFYATKEVQFHISSGFKLVDSKGRELTPDMLSSGERHLLMLFCYTLISRDKPSLFIIDEPELSLNVKWQRRLISALAALVADSGSQFLLATHSIELLAQHRHAVVELNPHSLHHSRE